MKKSIQLDSSTEPPHALPIESLPDRILEATVNVANTLLTVENVSRAVNTALQQIGEALDADRVRLIENFTYPTDVFPHWQVLYEWNSPRTISQIPKCAAEGSYSKSPQLYERFQEGQPVSYLIAEIPELFHDTQPALAAKSAHVVPIFVEDVWWGVLGLDDCRETKLHSLAELSVLKIAANCIGNAIQRKRTQQALLQAEQERSAELAKANDVLKRSLDALAVGSGLDQFIGHVLKTAAEQLDASVVEYWSISDNTAYLELTCWQGKVLTREQLADYPHKQVVAVPSELTAHATLIQHQRHSIVNDLLNHPPYLQLYSALECNLEAWCNQHNVRRELNVPLRLGTDTIGTLCIYVSADRPFTQQQIELSYTLAQQVTLALQLTQLAEAAKQAAIACEQEKAAKERAAELAKANDALKRSLDTLAAEPELERFLGYVLTEIARQADACTAHLFLYNGDTNTLALCAAFKDGKLQFEPAPGDPLMFYHPFDADITPAWRSLLADRTIYLRTTATQDEETTWEETKAWHIAQGHSTHAGIALVAGDQPVGLLGIAWRGKTTLTTEQTELVHALAQQATLAIQMTHLAEQAKQTAVLEERNRMAREIHDTIAQGLTGILIQLQAAEDIDLTDPHDRQDHVAQARHLAAVSLAEARRSVQALRPQMLEETNLAGALSRLMQDLTANTNLQVTCKIHGTPYLLPIDVETNLLRITQEAANNTLKHAQASKIQIKLDYKPDQVRLQVQDNGRGFDYSKLNERGTDKEGYGLTSMQERSQQINGSLTITSQAGQGTTVLIVVPSTL